MTFLTGIPRRNLFFFGLLAVILGVLFFVMVHVPQTARTHLESILRDAGFRGATVGSVTVRPSSIIAHDVKLDGDGFDKIKTLQADISWPSFLASGKISQLSLKDVSISRTGEGLGLAGQQLVSELLNLPDYRVNISNAIVDLSTMFGDLRVTADVTINTDNKPEERDIHANVKAAQYQLGFDSTWEGSLDKDGRLQLSANIQSGRFNMGPARVSRFNGWAGLEIQGGSYSFQSQMEAGGASLFGVPLHNVTLVNDHHAAESSVMLRAEIAGMPDSIITSDYIRKDEEQTFQTYLRGKSLGSLLDYIGETTKDRSPLRSPLAKAGRFEAGLSYQPDRRFVGGPLPFTVSVKGEDAPEVSGNILFYPETFDLRGSLETDPAMASALKDYFRIPSANVNRNFIRLDGNAKGVFDRTAKEETPN